MVSLDHFLGLPDVTVEHCVEHEAHIFLQLGMTTREATCPHCGSVTDIINQTRPILIRDLPSFGRPVYLQAPRQQFYCSSCHHYFTERLSFADPERNYTHRFEEYIYQRVKNSSIEQVSLEEDISTDRVRGIFEHVFEKRQAKKKPRGFGRRGSA